MAQSDASSLVYLVDNNLSVLRAFYGVLLSAGMETREFRSDDEFLASSIDARRACVVAGYIMPIGAGLSFARWLRESGRDVPVILLSAETNGQGRAAARLAGAFMYFRKPVDARALFVTIAWALIDYTPLAGTPDKGGQSGSPDSGERADSGLY